MTLAGELTIIGLMCLRVGQSSQPGGPAAVVFVFIGLLFLGLSGFTLAMSLLS
jgi:hypothetical protein